MPEIPSEREVAGLWCRDVLAKLQAFVDGELGEADVAAIEAHLRGCDWCESFGGAYASTVAALRARLRAADVDAALAARLDAALDAALGG